MYSHSLRERCQIALSFFHFVFFSFYDKKKFSSKKEQKTIDASEKVSTLSLVLLVHLIFATVFCFKAPSTPEEFLSENASTIFRPHYAGRRNLKTITGYFRFLLNV